MIRVLGKGLELCKHRAVGKWELTNMVESAHFSALHSCCSEFHSFHSCENVLVLATRACDDGIVGCPLRGFTRSHLVSEEIWPVSLLSKNRVVYLCASQDLAGALLA